MTKSPLKKGVFMLSLDTELAWGSVHAGKLKKRERLFQDTRKCITRLIELLEKYEIQATWAIVGHLFLKACSPENGIKHPEIVRPNYKWHLEDWFNLDPCSDVHTDPIWYGPDIVKQIMNCRVHQEIGCHTFSHIHVGENGCSQECFKSELLACQNEANKLGITLQSFVFPRNSVGHLDVLARACFSTYRGVVSKWYDKLPAIFPRLFRQVEYYTPNSPPVVFPEKVDNLWNIPASFFFPPYRRWPMYRQSVIKKVKSGLNEAHKSQRIFHLWFHPFNLANDPGSLNDLEIAFKEYSNLRSLKLIDNLTMGQLSQLIDNKPE